jgi:DNA-binding response OmpR family regulator
MVDTLLMVVTQTVETYAPPRTIAGRLMVVDDDPEIRSLLVRLLEAEGYQVRDVSSGREALALLATRPPDLMILDVMLDAEDGFALLAQIRRTSDLPIILVTARSQESDRVFGLKLGADDYVVKPFSSAELAARIETVLRRVRGRRGTTSSALIFDELEIDPDAREVRVFGRKIELTAKEFELLMFLARSPRRVFTRGQLLAQVWDSSSEWQDANTVTEHVRRIRRKIEPHPGEPRWIVTVRGAGYRFES